MGKMKKVVKGEQKRRKVLAAVMAAPQKKKKQPKRSGNGASSSGLLGQLGFGIGSVLGGPAGGLTGMAAGKLISRLTGFGDYKVNSNSISNGNSVPTFGNGGKGMRCMHREYLTDITGSVGFVNNSYSINPGLVSSFPWLSLIAADFEEYELDGLVYEYRPTSGSAISSTSSALGVVILATNYDSIDPLFATKQQMESYEYATSTVPFAGCMHPVECLRKLNVLGSQYIRTGDAPSGTDLRLYDVGKFQIATQGMQSAYVVGELWVSYDVVFLKPRLPPTISPVTYARFINSTKGTCSQTNPFGTYTGATGLQRMSDSTISPSVMFGTGNAAFTITTPGKYYLSLSYRTEGAGVSASSVTFNLGSNMSFLTGGFSWNTPATTQYVSSGPATGTFSNSVQAFIQVNTAGIANNAIVISPTALTIANLTLMVTMVGEAQSLTSNPFRAPFGTDVRNFRSLSDEFTHVSFNESDSKSG